MNICYSELILLNNDILENMKKLESCGSRHVELMMDAAGWESLHEDYKSIVPALKALDLHYSVHPAAWDINLTAEMDILRDAAYRHHIQALEFSAELGASHMVVHPGFCYSPCFSKETARKRAHETILRMNEKAEKLGVTLAWENVGYNGTSIYTQEQFIHSLDDVGDNVQFLIDIGHANVNGWDIPAVLNAVSGRCVGLHIHDNNGKADSHLPIGFGNADWPAIYKAMGNIRNKNCEFVLEYVPGMDLKYLEEGKRLLEQNVPNFS